MQKIWLITGISSGLGQALAQAVMAQGDYAVGTFRQTAQAEAFNQAHPQQGLGLVMDVTQPAQVAAAFATLQARLGRLDVLVNNAGFGFAGAVEEASEAEVRAVFEANFFGALRVTQAALPLMRQQGSGHIVQISSHGGVKAFPGFGIYSASKFALEGFSEALAAEVAPLGIKLTMVEPGPFRTAFADAGFHQAATVLPAYEATAGTFRQRMQAVNGKQEGDPAKAALAITQLVSQAQPPLRLPLGKIALGSIAAKLASVSADLEAGRAIAESAVFAS
ncbi:MAG: oxidoreductase [Bernardetiaceae bacterium]|jgi:NAD(P)-dependent dehydrogenase (short-subunit alcohol dehydrogenase family)|nr:oxidoreductase [Bernardetiaceae bacterium]